MFSTSRNIVSNNDIMHHLDSLLSIFSQHVKNVVSSCDRMHHLSSLLSAFSLRFQIIALKCNTHRPYFHISHSFSLKCDKCCLCYSLCNCDFNIYTIANQTFCYDSLLICATVHVFQLKWLPFFILCWLV